MGSETDLNVMKEALAPLDEFQIKYEIEIVSAHRTPEKMVKFAKAARKKGFGVIIAGAGGAAHLPGMVASLTSLPVIGVPVLIGKLQGIDALLSIAQMPRGVPVATVGIDNAYNAGLLALRMLALQDAKLAAALDAFLKKQKVKVRHMNLRLKKSRKATES